MDSQSIGSADVEQAQSIVVGTDKSLLMTLNQIGALDDKDLAAVFSRMTGFPIASPPNGFNSLTEEILSIEFMRKTKCLCFGANGPLLVVNPLDMRPLNAVQFALGRTLDVEIMEAGDWLKSYQSIYAGDEDFSDVAENLTGLEAELADIDRDAPIVRQVSNWLAEAADTGASDVHFDARRNAFEIQYRHDGLLRSVSTQSKSIATAVIARIKVLADLDLGERNKPQDGRATIVVRGRKLDVRVSIIPTIDGESAVIRLLDRPEGMLTLSRLGFSSPVQAELQAITNLRHGLFVVAGPTGSGKTTTLYACLEMLKDRGLKILSVEDPVEYHFEHVNQVQVSEKAGRNFAEALRSFLRHDPDVIMVGEIRDRETAHTAVQAALSGHLVLATIHAIDTARVRTRLIDMGIEPFRLDACLMGSLAQRLVRKLCSDCRQQAAVTEHQSKLFEQYNIASPNYVYAPVGCAGCLHDGYHGRTVLADFAKGAVSSENEDGLVREALQMVVRGETSFQEIAGLLS